MTTDERIESLEHTLMRLLEFLLRDAVSSSRKDKYGELLATMRPPSEPKPPTSFEKYCDLAYTKTHREIIEHKFTWNGAIDAVRQEIKEHGLTLRDDVLDNLRAE